MKQRVIRIKDVIMMTSLCRSSIYSYMAKSLFPKPIKIGTRAVAWRLSDIVAWLALRE
ncbi:helix-turn-helix transcriptional regulator [Sphingomonas sp. DC1100-1]|uniref:helix-turn-helix transcriptional regulator n=1 Tax=unclassified Sphingomonas TaxID=196159 RepID=UPI003CF5EA02